MSDGVSFLITILFSSGITLLVPYGSSGYNGLLVVLGIKPGVYNLDDYGSSACGLSV